MERKKNDEIDQKEIHSRKIDEKMENKKIENKKMENEKIDGEEINEEQTDIEQIKNETIDEKMYENKMSEKNGFDSLPSAEKENFTRLCNKLLSVGFLCKKKSGSRKDYYFIQKHREIFFLCWGMSWRFMRSMGWCSF
jgi:hypothetical protein